MVVNNDSGKIPPATKVKETTAAGTSSSPKLKTEAATAAARTNPVEIPSSTAQALYERPSHRYAARLRAEDRSAPKLVLNRHKDKIARELEREFQKPQSTPENKKYATTKKIQNSAFIQGPLGSFTSDIFLDRALTNLEKEKANINTENGASNIVIIGRRRLSCNRMARRLLRMADPQKRADLEKRIDVLDSYSIDSSEQSQESPRIIFIPLESIANALSQKGIKQTGVKRSLTGLTKYIKLDRLKYLYFDQAHMMSTEGRQFFLNYFKKNMDGRVGTGNLEIIGTSFCNIYQSDSSEDSDNEGASVIDIKEQLDRHHAMPSPEQLYRSIPETLEPIIKQTSIGSPLPEGDQVPGKQVNHTFDLNFASNEDWIEKYVIDGDSQTNAPGLKDLYKELTEDEIEDPRVMISTKNIKTTRILRDLLLARGYKVAITNSKDGNQFYPNPSKPKQSIKTEDRVELIDKFGKDFNILIHCGALDTEEIPADITMIYKVPSSSEVLEAFTASYRTPFDFEEYDPSRLAERPRQVWLLDRAAKEDEETVLKDPDYLVS